MLLWATLFGYKQLLLEGGLWLFTGAVCCFGVIAACFLVWFVNGFAKNLRDGNWQNGCN